MLRYQIEQLYGDGFHIFTVRSQIHRGVQNGIPVTAFDPDKRETGHFHLFKMELRILTEVQVIPEPLLRKGFDLLRVEGGFAVKVGPVE